MSEIQFRRLKSQTLGVIGVSDPQRQVFAFVNKVQLKSKPESLFAHG